MCLETAILHPKRLKSSTIRTLSFCVLAATKPTRQASLQGELGRENDEDDCMCIVYRNRRTKIWPVVHLLERLAVCDFLANLACALRSATSIDPHRDL
jgi:hypothetical protein